VHAFSTGGEKARAVEQDRKKTNAQDNKEVPARPRKNSLGSGPA